jgi:hypothetical protein
MRLRLLNSLETLPKWWGFVVLGSGFLVVRPGYPLNVPLVIGSISPFSSLGGQAIQRGTSFCPPVLHHGMCSFTGAWALFVNPFLAPQKVPGLPAGANLRA